MTPARRAIPALLFAVVVLCFWPALEAQFVNWDDKPLLLENGRWRGLGLGELRWMLTTMHMGHYQPLTWVTFGLDYLLWGMNPRGYHLTNVLLHGANAVAVYYLARALLRAAGAGDRLAAPALAALLFALHPLRVESVAWVTERRDLLSASFLLLAVLGWLRWVECGGAAAYAAALGCFVLSVLSKAWGMTLPVVLLLLDVWPLRRLGRGGARLIAEKLPFIAIAAATAAVALIAQRNVGATQDAAHLGVMQRVMQACYGLVFYVRKTIVPLHLWPAYLLDRELDPRAAVYLVSAALVLAAAVLFLAVRRRWPAVAVAFAAYAVLVAPVLGLAQSGIQIAADRYTYIAGIPLALLGGWAVSLLPARAAGPLAVAIVAALGVATWRQTALWHDSERLWTHTLQVDPENWLVYNLRGTAHQDAGEHARALDDFSAAIRLRPSYASAYNNRGRARIATGDLDGARADLDRALALDPSFVDARLNRGGIQLMQGDVANALGDLEAAVRLDPGSATAWYNLASAHAAVGRLDAAIEDTQRALAMAPPDGELRARAERKLAALYEATGRAAAP